MMRVCPLACRRLTATRSSSSAEPQAEARRLPRWRSRGRASATSARRVFPSARCLWPTEISLPQRPYWSPTYRSDCLCSSRRSRARPESRKCGQGLEPSVRACALTGASFWSSYGWQKLILQRWRLPAAREPQLACTISQTRMRTRDRRQSPAISSVFSSRIEASSPGFAARMRLP
jgi:hypothetical protein